MAKTFGDGYDWRGTAIQVGDTVIYGAGVGRSIAMVEAEVLELKGEKVKLKVRYRAYGGSSRDTVTVGCDRITVVPDLPPCALKTVQEEIEEDKQRSINWKSHNPFLYPEPKRPEWKDFQLPRTTVTYGTTAASPSAYTFNTGTYAGGSYYAPGQIVRGPGSLHDQAGYDAAMEKYAKEREVWTKSPCQGCPGTSYNDLGGKYCGMAPPVVD